MEDKPGINEGQELNILEVENQDYDFSELENNDLFADFEKDESEEEPGFLDADDQDENKGVEDVVRDDLIKDILDMLLEFQAEAFAEYSGNNNPKVFEAKKHDKNFFRTIAKGYCDSKGITGEQLVTYFGAMWILIFFGTRFIKANRIRKENKKKGRGKSLAQIKKLEKVGSIKPDGKTIIRSQFQFHKKFWDRGQLVYCKDEAGSWVKADAAIERPDMVEQNPDIIAAVQKVYESEKISDTNTGKFNNRVKDILRENYGYSFE